MKEKPKEKFIPSKSRVFKELFYLRRGDFPVTEYNLKIKKLVFEYGFEIDHLSTIYRFNNGLRPDFNIELIFHAMKLSKRCFF